MHAVESRVQCVCLTVLIISITENNRVMQDFGILVFCFCRPLHVSEVLESLAKQGEIGNVHVWIDGHQGDPGKKIKTDQVYQVVSRYPVGRIVAHSGNLGFRKLVLQALSDAVHRFRHILVLEDDCFPTRDAVKVFREELSAIETRDDIFSVYGSPFLVEAEKETCSRFQGWGWATTSEKLRPVLQELIECYSLTEEKYLEFVGRVLSPEVVARLDVTPPRLPTHTLRKFFAWDETIALLTALDGMSHKKTQKRTIYNFGIGDDAGHFRNIEWYRTPPFNMVSIDEVWDYF